jgi:CheY-like chemotaxis protein
MVAETNAAVRRRLEDALRADGCVVIVAKDGAGVVAYAEDTLVFDIPRPRVHVLVADADLDVRGAKVLSQLARMGWRLPTVLLAERLDDETRELAQRLDAAVIVGPPEPPRVLETVRGALTRLA